MQREGGRGGRKAVEREGRVAEGRERERGIDKSVSVRKRQRSWSHCERERDSTVFAQQEREREGERVVGRAALLPWLLLVNKIARTQRMIDLRGSRAEPRADRLLSCSCSINLTLCFCLPAAHDRAASPLSHSPSLSLYLSLSLFAWFSVVASLFAF